MPAYPVPGIPGRCLGIGLTHSKLHLDGEQGLGERASPCCPGGLGPSPNWSKDAVLILSLPEPPGSPVASHPSSYEEIGSSLLKVMKSPADFFPALLQNWRILV